MKPLTLLLSLFLFSCSSGQKSATITKIDHLYLTSNNASELFETLKTEFALPVIWEFQEWEDFTSGGVSLGNMALEIIEKRPGQVHKSFGIALESSQSVQKMIPELEVRQIKYGEINPSSNWTILHLENMLPSSVDLFLCDYHNRNSVQKEREKAREKLNTKGKNHLGIQFVKNIEVKTKAISRFKNQIENLPGILKKEDVFVFPEGVNLKLSAADSFAFSMTIKVKKMSETKDALDKLGFTYQSEREMIKLTHFENLTLHFFE